MVCVALSEKVYWPLMELLAQERRARSRREAVLCLSATAHSPRTGRSRPKT
jgi:hypothetical protein